MLDKVVVKPGLIAEVIGQDKIANTVTSWSVSDPTPTLGSNLLVDGDMEAADASGWNAGASATLTKETADPHGGTRNLKVARNAVNNPNAWQNVMSAGTFFDIQTYGRSDGNALVRQGVSGGVLTITGTASTSWQNLHGTLLPTGGTAAFWYAITSTGTEYCEYDDLHIKAILTALSGVNTHRSKHTVSAGITSAANLIAGVWSDGDSPTAPQNYILAYYNRTDAKVHLCKYLAGSYSAEIGNYAAAYGAGRVLKITPDGNDRIVSYNGVDLATYTLTDAAIIAGTCAGLFSTDATNITFTNALVEI